MDEIAFVPPNAKKEAYWSIKELNVVSIAESLEDRRICRTTSNTRNSGMFVIRDWVISNTVMSSWNKVGVNPKFIRGVRRSIRDQPTYLYWFFSPRAYSKPLRKQILRILPRSPGKWFCNEQPAKYFLPTLWEIWASQ